LRQCKIHARWALGKRHAHEAISVKFRYGKWHTHKVENILYAKSSTKRQLPHNGHYLFFQLLQSFGRKSLEYGKFSIERRIQHCTLCSCSSSSRMIWRRMVPHQIPSQFSQIANHITESPASKQSQSTGPMVDVEFQTTH
jgi:hypothetical protein